MSKQTNSVNIPSVTSSPGLEDGHSPCALLDGQTKGERGLDHVPASRSAKSENANWTKMPETFGPLFEGPSKSESLQLSLESRLQARMGAFGSLEYELTWKRWDMKSGPQICALRASPLRTCAKGFTGWPTASSRDWKDTPGMATEGVNPDGTKRKRLDQLPRVAALTGWGTPRVANNGGHGNVSRSADGMSRLEDQVHGITTNQSNAVMGKPAAFLLNPRFSLWLQGYPAMWSYCGEQAMQSSHNSRRRSSKPATK